MIFKHYKKSIMSGHTYMIGLNVYWSELYHDLTIDLILGKHVFVTRIGNTK